MRINYMILAHNHPSQLRRLIERLMDDKAYFYVHIDLKAEIVQFEKELKGIENIYLLNEDRIKVTWGSFSMVEATLLLIKKILKDEASGYCVLMSGMDYPIKTKKYIRDFLVNNYGINFISSESLNSATQKQKAFSRIEKYNFYLDEKLRVVESVFSVYESGFYKKDSKSIRKVCRILKSHNKYKWGIINILKKRKFPKYLRPYGGSQWWALPIETIIYVDDFIQKNNNYLKYHHYTHCPDEIFFHSIISSNFNKKDIKESVTYANWTRENTNLPVTFKLNDFEELCNVEDRLFARKFDKNVDVEILDKIDKYLLLNEV